MKKNPLKKKHRSATVGFILILMSSNFTQTVRAKNLSKKEYERLRREDPEARKKDSERFARYRKKKKIENSLSQDSHELKDRIIHRLQNQLEKGIAFIYLERFRVFLVIFFYDLLFSYLSSKQML